MVWQNRRVNSGFLARNHVRKFRSDPNIPTSSFMETVKEDCMYEISKHQFYRTRSKCAEVINGIVAEQYKILWDYGEELKRTNPGSTVQIEVSGHTFKRMYICIGACKEGFKAGCRPVVGLDGCFLKFAEGGQLLAAVGIDGENCMFPLAWAVVDAENKTNWQWFIELLVGDIGMHNPRVWTFIFDKQKGLVDSISQYCEGAEHRCCARHLYSNFILAYKGLALKNLFWIAARATTVLEWKSAMNELKDISEEAYNWFLEKPPSQWTRSHFEEHSRCDILLNNLCEAFNSSIVVARDRPIISMLEKIRHQQMIRMNAKREAAERWDHAFGPRIVKIIEKAKSEARYLKADYAGNQKFEISSRDGLRWSVDLTEHACACRKWQLTGIPCPHAISGMLSRDIGIYEYIDPWLELWPELGKHPLTQPQKRKQAGRPKKLRKRSQAEPPTGVKMGRTSMKMMCKRRGGSGHNKRSCKEALPGDDSSQQQSQATTQEDTHTRSTKGKRKAHSTQTSKSKTKKSKHRGSQS
ncbi:uncharacterized protein LOC111382693 [Olea europaea var. sylvestris]|uniref:uncharacterized protein LOC111382693 n=1 Tax=Olea europaea var. sylvestris TaxID=158386 RepID=UPI000C1D37AC|nr:uncharacterized protein LOC111382693 [Olea europaea var. sylvestris]